MLELAETLRAWCLDGREFAVATVVDVRGSAPRAPGAALAVAADGTAVGSVSGGCVEAAVYELCRESLADGAPRRERFGYADDDALAVGLTCGGTVEVLVTPVGRAAPARRTLAAALAEAGGGRPLALARIVVGPPELRDGALLVRPDGTHRGTLGGRPGLDRAAAAEAAALLDAGRTGLVHLAAEGGRCGTPVTLLVETSLPPPRMLVFGAVDFAAALAGAGAFLGYRVTVCDARPVFATPERFPAAHEVVVDWPHRYLDTQRDLLDGRTAICVLTHDARFDVPLLTRALALPVGYVGALGSLRTHADRLRRLRAAGVPERRLAALRSPIGLDLGARTPAETALSITAEIVALRRGGSGVPLTDSGLSIHHETTAALAPAPAGSTAA
ncbi:XdhC family protein [Streptomyces mayteni]